MHAERFVCRIVLMAVWTVGIGYAGYLFGAEGGAREKGNKAAADDVPRELAMCPLPAYRVEPPDTWKIVKLIPLRPYRISVHDVLQIRVMGTMLDQPIDGFFLVEGEGVVSLGPAYGTVRVAGMTIPEATKAITTKLQDVLRQPDVSVNGFRFSAVDEDRWHAGGHRSIFSRTGRYRLGGADKTMYLVCCPKSCCRRKISRLRLRREMRPAIISWKTY